MHAIVAIMTRHGPAIAHGALRNFHFVRIHEVLSGAVLELLIYSGMAWWRFGRPLSSLAQCFCKFQFS